MQPQNYTNLKSWFSPGVDSTKSLGGGLNSTAGPLQLKDEESSDLQNIDFNKFGSILKRNGYTALNTSAISGGAKIDGLYWFEYNSSGTLTRYAICITNGKIYQMSSSLGGTWTDITGSVTITAGNHCDFETAFNRVYITNGVDAPFQWSGSGNAAVVPAFGSNHYTFQVSGITTTPTAGAVYHDGAATSFTIVAADLTLGSGQLIASASGAPQTSGTLTKDSGTGDSTITYTAFGTDVNITKARFVKLYNNYLFWLGCTVGSTYYPSRFYWSNIIDSNTVLPTSFIDVNINDGMEIQGARVLSDNLIIFKTRKIFSLSFTGDSDIPFILPGGGDTNSSVGCIAPFSIVSSENGIVFLAQDGIYIFDGSNAYKLSDRVTTTLFGFNTTKFSNCVATSYKYKNVILFAFSSSASSTNDTVLVWNYFLNAWSIYKGMNICSIWTFFINGTQEVPYFGDYSGFVYKMDTGTDDYPSNTKTAINAYYYTNWRDYNNLVSQKYTPQVNAYYELNDAILDFVYSYDFESTDQYTINFSTQLSGALYGSAIYGTDVYSGTGGYQRRIDLTGRGRVIRMGFKNANIGETFEIHGIGTMVEEETNV